jgi:hypothetical protein
MYEQLPAQMCKARRYAKIMLSLPNTGTVSISFSPEYILSFYCHFFPMPPVEHSIFEKTASNSISNPRPGHHEKILYLKNLSLTHRNSSFTEMGLTSNMTKLIFVKNHLIKP